MWKLLRRVSLTQWIIVSMALGILLGWAAPDAGMAMTPLSTVFLRMIKSIIVPLIFSTLVIGIAGHGDDLKQVGRLALKSIVYFEFVTTLALFIGLGAVNLVRPGVGVSLPPEPGRTAAQLAENKVSLGGMLEHLVPQSFFEAATNNAVLQVVF